jgi:hypothetical protein
MNKTSLMPYGFLKIQVPSVIPTISGGNFIILLND